MSVASGAADTEQPPQPSAMRIAEDLRRIAEIGGGRGGEVTRLAFTPTERAAHELVGGWMREAGLSVRTDGFGNTIGEQPPSGRPYLALGSHLDSVPHGGRYDGTVGVVAGLEVARMLSQGGTGMTHPVRLVAFANEEGARFGEACLGSKAIAGVLGPGDPERLVDSDGVTLAEAMRRLSMHPERIEEARWPDGEAAAFLELHIEQGRVLESEGMQLGVVDAIAGNTRLRAVLEGQADHSGGTRMHERRDALAAASETVLAIESLANERERGSTVATVGRLEVFPNNITTIPGRVRMAIDVRDVDSARQRDAARSIIDLAERICQARDVRISFEVVSDTSPSILPLWLRRIGKRACEQAGVRHRILSSGAGHDAQVMARRLPAILLFVPSRDGRSHVPEEWTSAEDIAVGVRVLCDTLLALDAFLVGLAV